MIERGLVIDQAKYLMVVFRRKVLLAPAQWAARISREVEGANEHAVARILDEGVRELLTELKELPRRITDPGLGKSYRGRGERFALIALRFAPGRRLSFRVYPG